MKKLLKNTWCLAIIALIPAMKQPQTITSNAHTSNTIIGNDSANCKTYLAINMEYTDIEGFKNGKPDKKAGKDILQIPNRMAWAAARFIYDGSDGDAIFTLNTMQETDGESTYKVRVNGELVGEVTNDKIHGTSIPDYTIQSHLVNSNKVTIKSGDLVQIEFCNTTNGLVPEGELTATARGRWYSLEICICNK